MNSAHFRQRNYLSAETCLSDSPTWMVSSRGLHVSAANAGKRLWRLPTAGGVLESRGMNDNVRSGTLALAVSVAVRGCTVRKPQQKRVHY